MTAKRSAQTGTSDQYDRYAQAWLRVTGPSHQSPSLRAVLLTRRGDNRVRV